MALRDHVKFLTHLWSTTAGMYSALPYAVAQGTVETPYIFVQALFFSVITYFLYHLQVDAGETHVTTYELRLLGSGVQGVGAVRFQVGIAVPGAHSLVHESSELQHRKVSTSIPAKAALPPSRSH